MDGPRPLHLALGLGALAAGLYLYGRVKGSATTAAGNKPAAGDLALVPTVDKKSGLPIFTEFSGPAFGIALVEFLVTESPDPRDPSRFRGKIRRISPTSDPVGLVDVSSSPEAAALPPLGVPYVLVTSVTRAIRD